MTYDQDIATALKTALPVEYHSFIFVLAQTLADAIHGNHSRIDDPTSATALSHLQGQTLNVRSGSITFRNRTDKGIIIEHNERSIELEFCGNALAQPQQNMSHSSSDQVLADSLHGSVTGNNDSQREETHYHQQGQQVRGNQYNAGRDVHVHYYTHPASAEDEPSRPFAITDFDPHKFVDRKDEIRLFQTLLRFEGAARILALCAGRGSGKSHLIRYFRHLCTEQHIPVSLIDFRQLPNLSPPVFVQEMVHDFTTGDPSMSLRLMSSLRALYPEYSLAKLCQTCSAPWLDMSPGLEAGIMRIAGASFL